MSKHFFIVGAQRSGTTYLYELLNKHPDICMNYPVRPEPKYFLNRNADLVNVEQYRNQFFSHVNQDHVLGEKSTSYYESETAAKIIYNTFPDAKIIFCLRNPVDRAVSNYFFSVNNGLEKRSIEQVFTEFPVSMSDTHFTTSVNPFDYLGRGVYARFLKMYMNHFPSSQIKVLIFEELLGNKAIVEDLFKFLEVEHLESNEQVKKVINASEKNSEIALDVSQFLSDYYVNSISELETMLSRKIAVWK